MSEYGSADDLVKKMQDDEREHIEDLTDSPLELELMSPRDYAKANDMVPQQVYYYIRTGVIKSVACLCGRTVIEKKQADDALAKKRQSRNTKGIQGPGVV
jgi:hypothetical protein